MAHDDEEEDDSESEDDSPIDCPHCGASIYSDSEQCPRCGQYISEEEQPSGSGKPWWIILGALACLAATLLAIR